MRKKTDQRFEGVRAFKRGLDVLQEVNRSGGIRAGEVAERLKLARPTVYRLLETLEELGYIERSSSDERFRVTRLASNLGDGYDPSIMLCQSAAPVLTSLGQRLIWPVDLSTYENAGMVIQETTHARSPLSIDRGMIGRRLPMLRTSAGRAYLSWCPPAEREEILAHLRRIDCPEDRSYLASEKVSRMVAESRDHGYSTRTEREYNPKTSSIAVPVIDNDRVLGCLSVIWISTALTLEEAVARFYPHLRDGVAEILLPASAAAGKVD